ncbi:MAG TPA: flagellar motor switch protein FliG [Mariprofundaceae bacterium]|nr:flagellar motor switch protein FliG [Mariprofundaceae bacterium]
MNPDDKKLEGPDKAAMFLLSIGPELSGPIMQHMDDDGLMEIARRMPKVGRFGGGVLHKVFEEFEEMHQSGGGMMMASADDVEKMLKDVVDGPRLQRIMESLNDSSSTRVRVWDRLSRMKPKAVFALIRHEKPQTIAIILGHINPDLASSIIELLPEEMRTSVVLRMSKLESVPTDLILDIEEALDKEMSDVQGGSGLTFDGMIRVVEILKTLDSNISKPILESLREKDPELFEQVDSQLLVFEDFTNLDDRDIQQVLKNVSSEDLVKALKGASEDLRDLFFKNMSSRAADIMREDMEVMGPLKVSDVESAQRTVLEVARKLDEEGAITLGQQEDLVY